MKNSLTVSLLVIGAYLLWASRTVTHGAGSASSSGGYIAVGERNGTAGPWTFVRQPQPYDGTLDGPSTWESSGTPKKACGGFTRNAAGVIVADVCY